MNILVINGHPETSGLCNTIVTSYVKGISDSENEYRVITVRDLVYPKDIESCQKDILCADQLTFIYPLWWADAPSIVKQFWEKVFERGFAYRYEESTYLPKIVKLLKRKSVRIITTMDSPTFFYKYFMQNPTVKVTKANCNTCGMKFKGSTEFGSVRMSNEKQREKWIEKVRKIGTSE